MNSANYNDEEFENLNDIETVLSSIGIKLRENAKEWRDIDDVLQDIADNWDNWDQTTQNAVATAVAGTRQRENVLQLFSNWDEVDKYAEIAANSYGTATEKMEAYTSSIEASKERIQVAIEQWALKLDGTEAIKKFYDSIAYITENLHLFALSLLTYSLALNKNGIEGALSNVTTKLSMKLSDVSLVIDKYFNSKNLSEDVKNARIERQNKAKEEDWIYAQQNMFQPNFDRAIKRQGLSIDQAGMLKDTQREVLGLSKKQKVAFAKNMRDTDAYSFGMRTGILDNYNESTGEYTDIMHDFMDAEEAKTLATVMLTRTEKDADKQILERIKNGELENLSVVELQRANEMLAKAREDSAYQEMADEAERSAELGTQKEAARRGKMMVVGATVGGLGAGKVLGDAFEGKEFLGLDLGSAGQILGGNIGTQIGAYAGKAFSDGALKTFAKGIPQAASIFATGSVDGILTALGGASVVAGVAAIIATALVGVIALIKKIREEQVKKAQEAFKEAEQKFSAAKGSNVTAKQYDELAKGVDNFGRNVSLTDEEYQEFLDKSNELAELFPELIVRTDEEGNKLVGLGNAVGGVAEEVANLNKQLQHEADIKLLDDKVFGDAVNNTFGQVSEIEKKIKGLENETDTQLLKDIYSKYGVEYEIGRYQGGGEYITVSNEEDAFRARRNAIQEYENEIKALKGTMIDYARAEERELRRNSVFDDRISNMSDNQRVIYQNMVDNIEVEKRDENGNLEKDSFGNYLRKSDEEIRTEINNIANLVDGTFKKLDSKGVDIEVAFRKPDSYNTVEELQKAKDELRNALMSIFGADGISESEEQFIIGLGLGFEVKDNQIVDSDNILTNFKKLGVTDRVGRSDNDAITIQKLSSLSPEDAKSAFELMNSGIVKVTGSWQTLLNLIESDRGPIKTVEGYSQYFQMLLTQEEEFQDEFNKVIDSKRENKNIKMSAGYILTGMTDEEIDESFSKYNSSIRGGIKNAKKNYEKNINEYGKSVEEANELLQKELDGLFDSSKISALQGQLKLQLSEQFSNVDLGDDGLVSSFSELKDVLDSLADSFDRLKEAQNEYNSTGKLSMQTVLDLISTDANYLNVLDLSGDSIKLNSNAEQILMEAKINTAKAALLEMRNSQLVRAQKIQEALVTDNLVEAEGIEQESTLESIEKNTALNNTLIQQSNAALAAAYGLKAKSTAEKTGEVSLDDVNNKNWYQTQSEISDSIKAPTVTNKEPKKLDATTREQLLKEYESLTGISRGDAFVIGRDGQVLASKIDLNQDKYLNGGGFTFGGSIGALDKLYGMDTWDNFQKKYKTPDTKDNKYDPMTKLEALKKMASLIDKEWEAMLAKNAGRYTNYFKDMGDNLAEQKKAVLEEIVLLSAELEKLTPGTEEYDKKYSELNERQADLIDIEKKIANLDDEEIEDEISRLNNREATVEALIEQQKLLLKAADTEDEIIERQKELNDLVRQERDLRKSINDYHNDLLDMQLEYNSGTAYSDSDTYDALVNQKIENFKKNAEIALEAIGAETKMAFDEYMKEVDANGNKLYTTQEAWYKAQNSEKVQQATKEYIEAVQAQAELAVQAVTDKLDEISREIDILEKQKPQEWSSIDQIKDYADSTIDYLNKKLTVIQDALKDTSGMTDDQIKDLVDQLNEVTVTIHEAQVQMHEDIKSQQEATYSALVNQVQRYIDELERAKDAVEDAYKDPIEDVENYNKALDRTNKLLELQKNLQNASREKQRVYREGIGWVYESNREKVKQAQQELDDFYRNDKLNDLEEAKNNELALLDERIKGWNKYLEALKERYDAWQVQEEQKLLMELTNVKTEEELYQKILDDMLNYNENTKGCYDDYIGIFKDFLAEYKTNLEELQRLKEQELTLMSASNYLGGNGISIPMASTNDKGTGMDIFGSWEEGHNYLAEALKYAKDGDMDSAYDALMKRGYKIQSTGINYGTTQEEALDMVLEAGNAEGYATGLDQGPVTYTGLTMLHGTPSAPEYVLNNDQAYNLLYNMSSSRMAEFENTSKSDSGIQYIVQGDIILEGIEDPAKFWQEVTNAMGNRWNVTKNK